MGDHPDDDVSERLVALLDKQITAGAASTDALRAVAAEVGAFRGRLDVLARVETALEASTKALEALRPLLEELAARRAADAKALEDQHRREGYDRGRADADKAHAESVRGTLWSGLVAWGASPTGRMSLGGLLVLAVGAVATLLLPWVDLAALRAVLGGAP